ncbi:hypothetical protein [Actinophytocola sp.]
MTPEMVTAFDAALEEAFDAIRQEYGAGSIDRVEAVLDPSRQIRALTG